jgi:predicted permease
VSLVRVWDHNSRIRTTLSNDYSEASTILCGTTLARETLEVSMDSIKQDVIYALRQFRKRPAASAVAILILAVAIGANAAIFSVVHAVLWKVYPYKEPDRLVQFWETNPIRGWTMAPAAPANVLDWQKQNTVFDSIGFYYAAQKVESRSADTSHLTLGNGPKAESVRAMYVSGSLFRVLGTPAFRGRILRDEETWYGKHQVAVLSYRLWNRAFGGEENIIGKSVQINGRSITIVGIMPEDFYFPSTEVDLWLPMGWESNMVDLRRPHFLWVIARLKDGIDLEKARTEMHLIAKRLEQQYPDVNKQMGVGLDFMTSFYTGEVRSRMLLVFCAVLFVLLVGCANLANLILAQNSSRAREVAVRLSLGAGKWRLIRQFFTEHLILSLIATAVGLLLASWIQEVLIAWNPGDIPRLEQATLNSSVLLFAACLSFCTPIFFGLFPLLKNFDSQFSELLKEQRTTATKTAKKTRTFLLILQIALSLVLLSGAGLMVKSFFRLQRVDPGFDPRNVLTFDVSLPGLKYPEEPQANQYFHALVRGIETLPGVQSAAATSVVPMRGTGWTSDLTIEGDQPGKYAVEVQFKEMTPKYFSVMKIPILAGRDFRDPELETQKVVIINQALAKRYFGTQNPIGKRVKLAKPEEDGEWLPVVGVVANEKQKNLSTQEEVILYQPLQQNVHYTMTMVVRSSHDPSSLGSSIRQKVLEQDPDVPPYQMATLQDVVDRSISREKFVSFLLGLFAITAVLLAAIGVYGVLSYMVSQRNREVAVRMAIGARKSEILRLIIGDGVKPAIIGVLAGFILSLVGTQLISSLLFEVQPTDPAVLASVCLFLVIVAAAASYFPASRASDADPAAVLRHE